jgi:hypothetical protein
MRPRRSLVLALPAALLAAALAGAILMSAAGGVGSSAHGAPAPGARTLGGEYSWGSSARGPVEAVFAPAGASSWTVDFRFTFDGRRQRWSGVAEGSLDAGRLTGEVEEHGRTFRFRGEVVGGVFRGRHAEVFGGEEEDTGTLVLSPR